MAFDPLDLAGSVSVPQANGAVASPGGDKAANWGISHGDDRIGMAFELLSLAKGGDFPQAHQPILAAGGERAAVGAEREGQRTAGVGAEVSRQRAFDNGIEKMDMIVAAAGREQPAVRCERKRHDSFAGARVHVKLAAAGSIP